MSLENNRALNLTNAELAQRVPAALRWQREWEKVLSGSEPERLLAKEERQGKGGAGYIALRNHRVDSSVTLRLHNLNVEQNSAGIGGDASRA